MRRSQWLQTGSHSGLHCLQLSTAAGICIFYNTHLISIRSHDLLPLIYTSAPLIDGSVKGQYVTFRDCSECTNYNWYHCHLHVPCLFLVLWQGLNSCVTFHFLWFSFSGLLGWQSPLNGRVFFFLVYYHLVWSGLSDLYISQNPKDNHLNLFR